jgi:pimeloyl-ACP methyl ester carboxylesterase
MGGLIALEIAARHPDIVDGLVMLDADPDPPLRLYEPLRRSGERAGPVYPSIERAVAAREVQFRAVEDGIRDHLIRESLRKSDDGVTLKVDYRALAKVEERHLNGLLPALRCPMAVVRGSESEMLPAALAAQAASLAPIGRIAEIPGGHLMFLESPHATRQFLTRFLSEECHP